MTMKWTHFSWIIVKRMGLQMGRPWLFALKVRRAENEIECIGTFGTGITIKSVIEL